MILDDSQKAFCETVARYVRLLAPAGSGKTLSLLWRCRWLYEHRNDRPCRFLIFTFTQAARDELKDRLLNDPDFARITQVVRVDTLNRWGYNYLKRYVESSLEVKASKSEKFFLVKNVLRPIWTKHPVIKASLEKNRWKYSRLMDLIDMMKTSGFRHNHSQPTGLYDNFESHRDWLRQNGLGRYFLATIFKSLTDLEMHNSECKDVPSFFRAFLPFWKEACDHLWESAVISLDDQKYWTLLKLDERYGEGAFPEPNRFQHIMVDEFQDINPLDLFLIKKLVSVNRASLTIVGDDDQAIYEWRGSTPGFILEPDLHLENAFEHHELTVNYRSPKNIIAHSQDLIRNNQFRVDKQVLAHCQETADITVKSAPSHVASLEFIMEIARAANASGTARALAVVGRKKSQIIPLQIIMTSEGIPFYAKEDLNVLLSRPFEDVKEILFTIATKNDRKYAKDIVTAFLRFCNYVSTYPLKRADQTRLFRFLMANRPQTFMEVLGHFQEYTGPLRGSTDEASRLEYLMAIAKIVESETVYGAIEEIGVQLKGLQKHYAKSEDDIFYKDPPFLYLAEYAKRYNKDFLGFIDHVEKAISLMQVNPYTDTDEVDPDMMCPVHLMTALRAKGKEFDTVILLDVNDGIWPSKMAETEQELEQERRVFYVAVTRPRRRLILISVDSILNKRLQPSPYIREMGLELPSSEALPG